jgi:hypothetical protein
MQMHELHFKALEDQWHELYDQYESVKTAQPLIVRWEWTRRKRYDPRAYYFQRHAPRGRVLNHLPANDDNKAHKHEYGFDAQNRVVFERYYTHPKTEETFLVYEPNRIVRLSYQKHQGRFLLSSIAHFILEAQRVMYSAGLSLKYEYVDPTQRFHIFLQDEPYRGEGLDTAQAHDTWQRLSYQTHAMYWNHETYIYNGRQLRLIEIYNRPSQSTPFETQEHFEYDDQGHLQRIRWERKDGYRGQVRYRRRKRGETFASFVGNAKQKLIETIPQAVAATKFQEPLYGLNLYYDLIKWGDYFPPELWPAFERDRQQKLQGEDRERFQIAGDIWWYLWSDDDIPEDIQREPIPTEDEDTLEACERLNVEVNTREAEHILDTAIKTLYEICQELNRLDWSQYAPVTSDFIVYACDQTEHVNIADTLRLSGATEEQIQDWYRRGMLDDPSLRE